MTIKLLVTDTDNLIQLITGIGNLFVILVLFIIAASVIRWAFTYERRHMERSRQYQEWYDEVVSDPNPDKKALIKIVKLRRHTSHIFYQAVQEKLESYEHTANTIEATMSPVQLYEVGNPLGQKASASTQFVDFFYFTKSLKRKISIHMTILRLMWLMFVVAQASVRPTTNKKLN